VITLCDVCLGPSKQDKRERNRIKEKADLKKGAEWSKKNQQVSQVAKGLR
jgi:hypothetical protein